MSAGEIHAIWCEGIGSCFKKLASKNRVWIVKKWRGFCGAISQGSLGIVKSKDAGGKLWEDSGFLGGVGALIFLSDCDEFENVLFFYVEQMHQLLGEAADLETLA